MLIKIFGIAIAIALAGCVAVGTQIKKEQLTGFATGVTTYEEVISRLGQPNTLAIKSNGTRVAIYTYIHSQPRPESFIPFVGIIVGGADSKINTTEFTFDAENKLLEYSLSESNYGAGTGLSAGAYQDRATDQPQQAR